VSLQANVLTGAVNLSTRTILVPPARALLVVLAYTALVTAFAVLAQYFALTKRIFMK
jgi:hypothetical protein